MSLRRDDYLDNNMIEEIKDYVQKRTHGNKKVLKKIEDFLLAERDDISPIHPDKLLKKIDNLINIVNGSHNSLYYIMPTKQ